MVMELRRTRRIIMDVGAVNNAKSNNISDSGVSQAVVIDKLKKAVDIDKESATALIQATSEAPATPNLPPNLGQNVNTTA